MPDSSSTSTFFNTDLYADTGCPVDVSEEEYEASLDYLIQVERTEELMAGAPELQGLETFDFGPETTGFPYPALTAEEEAREEALFSAPTHDELPF